MSLIQKVLLDIDNPTRQQIKKALDKDKAERAKMHRGLYLPNYQTPCPGCGEEKPRPVVYFGEKFCKDCVEQWTTK